MQVVIPIQVPTMQEGLAQPIINFLVILLLITFMFYNLENNIYI